MERNLRQGLHNELGVDRCSQCIGHMIILFYCAKESAHRFGCHSHSGPKTKSPCCKRPACALDHPAKPPLHPHLQPQRLRHQSVGGEDERHRRRQRETEGDERHVRRSSTTSPLCMQRSAIRCAAVSTRVYDLGLPTNNSTHRQSEPHPCLYHHQEAGFSWPFSSSGRRRPLAP